MSINQFTIIIDPGNYKGQYAIGKTICTGISQVQLAPGTYTFDNQNRIQTEFGASFFNFTVGTCGNVTDISNSAAATANGNTLKLNNAQVTVNPGAYQGSYLVNGASADKSTNYTGQQTFTLIPGMAFGIDAGNAVAVEGLGASFFYIGLDACGNITGVTNTVAASVEGNTVTFHSICVIIDPGAYTGQYRVSRFSHPFTGKQTLTIVPTVVYGIDLGAAIGGAVSNGLPCDSYFFFSADAAGNIIGVSNRMAATYACNTLALRTVQVTINPGAFKGTYKITGFPNSFTGSARQTLLLVPGILYGIDNGNAVGGSVFYFMTADGGLVWTTNASAEGCDGAVNFNSVNVKIEPVDYTEHYRVGGYGQMSSVQTLSLIAVMKVGISIGSNTAYFTPGLFNVDRSSLQVGTVKFNIKVV